MKFFVLLTFFVTGYTAYAQLPKTAAPTVATPAIPNAGSLLAQFTEAIQPAQFTDAFAGQRSNFLGNARKVATAAAFAQQISTLVGFLKPSAFRQGFNVQNLLQTAGTVKTLAGAAGLVRSLEGGLRPDAFSAAWKQQRAGWLNGLNLLK